MPPITRAFRLNVALAMNEYTNDVATAEEAREYLPQAIERATEKIDTRHFKYWGDGTPISYTSLLVEPYADRDTFGSITMTDEMIEDALGQFRARAKLIARGMGAKDWSLIEVSVGSTGAAPRRLMTPMTTTPTARRSPTKTLASLTRRMMPPRST